MNGFHSEPEPDDSDKATLDPCEALLSEAAEALQQIIDELWTSSSDPGPVHTAVDIATAMKVKLEKR